MTRLCKILSSFVFILQMICVCQMANADMANNIVVKLSVNKNVYLEGEPIFLTIEFKNYGLLTDSINYYTVYENCSNIQLMGPAGEIKLVNEAYVEFSEVPMYTISAGDKLGLTMELLANFIPKWSLPKNVPDIGCIPAGDYRLSFDCFEKCASFDTLAFTIKPAGGPEREAFEILMRANRMIIPLRVESISDRDTLIAIKDKYVKILEEFPESVYWERACFGFNSCLRYYGVVEKAMYFDSVFVSKYPNSIYVEKGVMKYLCRTIDFFRNDKEAVHKYLDWVIKTMPGTLASKTAENYRKKDNYKW
jgi:hypothetical protein